MRLSWFFWTTTANSQTRKETESNPADGGVVPERNHPFRFLRRSVRGRGAAGRDWRTDGVGKTEADGG